MHEEDLTGKSDQGIVDIISKARRTAEKLEEATKNCGTKTPMTKEQPEGRSRANFQVKKDCKEPSKFKEKMFVDWQGGGSVKTFATQSEGVS